MDIVYIIAEMACSHDGNLENARRIAEAAGNSGANALQLQIWQARDLMVPHHPDFSKLTALQLAPEDWRELVLWTRTEFPQLEIQACVYDVAAIEFAASLNIDLLKIHAGEIANQRLLETAARFARRIDLCVGACRWDEIEQALATLRAEFNPEVWLLYGIQSFPTPLGEVHLPILSELRERFHLPVGYQDHCDANNETAFWIPAAAIGMGATILEKHLTDDRSRRGADYQSALEPDEFVRFVQMVRSIEQARRPALTDGFSNLQSQYRASGSRTLVARRALALGMVLTEEDLIALRSSDQGLSVHELPQALGRVLRRALLPFEPIREEDLR